MSTWSMRDIGVERRSPVPLTYPPRQPLIWRHRPYTRYRSLIVPGDEREGPLK